MGKTNAVRIIEQAGVDYSLFEYEFSEDEIDAVSVAKKIGAPPEEVFKTLVARNNISDILVFVLPGNFELDLKKAAQVSHSRKIELISLKELLPLTGYIRGGCSPVGMKKKYLTFIDEAALLFDEIYVSAGVRGIQIKINPESLAELVNANFAEIT
ncbi:MAG: Cys-tRNA(Pro)/Cys-tRNA(Cys) deacylase [Melioribacteraceae bacterium]|nr:MAG: Cys-tRNA(Pro)/Cys-tRNA(Cys) deacylase [Melioribacteraceae bacterium]